MEVIVNNRNYTYMNEEVCSYLYSHDYEKVELPCDNQTSFHLFCHEAYKFFHLLQSHGIIVNLENMCIKYILDTFLYTLKSCDKNYQNFYDNIQYEFESLSQMKICGDNYRLRNILEHVTDIIIKMSILLENVFECEAANTIYTISSTSYNIDHVLSIIEKRCKHDGIIQKYINNKNGELSNILSSIKNEVNLNRNNKKSFMNIFAKTKETGLDEKYIMVCFELLVIGANKCNQVLVYWL